MRPLRVLALLLVAVLALALGACSGSDDEPAQPPTDVDDELTAGTAPGATTGTTAPEVDQLEAASIAAGDQHACALDADGTAWCWGYNRFGQLGDGTFEDADTPVAVDTDATFTQLASGRYFTCGITDDGPTLCWGDNSSGSLGNGEDGGGSSDADQPSPVPVATDVAFTQITAGQQHGCGLDADGAAWCWGAYASGQLGSDVGELQTTPVPAAAGITFAALGLRGEAFTCGVATDGAAWCWGNDSFGQLGRGDVTNVPQPVPSEVAGGHTWSTVVQGRNHTCAIDEDGALWCWGANDGGQLGDGTTTDSPVPVAVAGGHTFTDVTADDRFTCAIDDEGAAWCWGVNVDGRLGDGTTDDALEPVAVVGDLTFASLSAGEEFACGVDEDDGAWCWGSNRVGWLGDGSDETSSEVPVPVAAP